MPKTWITTHLQPPPVRFQKKIGGHPFVAQILYERGFTDPKSALTFLNPDRYIPSSPLELPNLSKAAERIDTAIQNQENILVWGDFDVDGQTATTLLFEALEELGALISYHIPIRATEGHGIRPDVLKRYLDRDPRPDLIITCDTGISEHEAVEYAQSQGIDVIITDHHELPERLPRAYSVVNTHMLPEGHSLSTLPGVGVAYKLVEELFNQVGNKIRLPYYLDLVALGIVADVAELKGDSRYLLQLGLRILRRTTRLGLQTLYETIGINPEEIDEDHIGFSIGPRLNALGRLSDANPIVEFFTTNDLNQARILSSQLEGLNHRRKLLVDQVYQGALAQIDRDPSHLEYAALVLAHPGWPNGVIGIVASQLSDKFGVPTILFSIQDEKIARGSARSVEGIHIKDAITAQSDLLIAFGGHAGAAGLSLLAKDVPEFRIRLSRTIRRMKAGSDTTPKVFIDGFVNLSDLSINFVDEIERLAPFGSGNPPIILATRELRLVNHTKIGTAREHLKLVVEDKHGNFQDFLWWRGAGESLPDSSAIFDLAFIPSSNNFRGEKNLQLQWVDYRIDEISMSKVEAKTSKIEIVDYRNETNKQKLINAIYSKGKIQVWAEGDQKSRVYGLDRSQLKPASSLAIWTTPPGYWELQTAIEKVNPDSVYLFTQNPGIDESQAFLTRLAGLVKHVLNRMSGETNLTTLAANMAHMEGTVRMGLFWLEAKGIIRFNFVPSGQEDSPKNLFISKGNGEGRPELVEITEELLTMLEETKAFRSYFERTMVNSLNIRKPS